jgi:hypothetical protein
LFGNIEAIYTHTELTNDDEHDKEIFIVAQVNLTRENVDQHESIQYKFMELLLNVNPIRFNCNDYKCGYPIIKNKHIIYLCFEDNQLD